jgi:tRNA(Ile2) C34 agmatinyltransferase TiaS
MKKEPFKISFKTICQHCGKRQILSLTGNESEAKCKHCKKELNTKFNFNLNTLTLF